MKKNKYKPETEFEKEAFSDLIDKIRSVKEEELSEGFSNDFSSALEKVIPIKPLGMRLRELTGRPKFKLYISFASAALALLVVFITFSQKNISSKYNLPGKDSKNIIISSDSLKLTNNKNAFKKMDVNAKPQNYISGNNKKESSITDKALSPKLYKPDSLNKILKSFDSLSRKTQRP